MIGWVALNLLDKSVTMLNPLRVVGLYDHEITRCFGILSGSELQFSCVWTKSWSSLPTITGRGLPFGKNQKQYRPCRRSIKKRSFHFVSSPPPEASGEHRRFYPRGYTKFTPLLAIHRVGVGMTGRWRKLQIDLEPQTASGARFSSAKSRIFHPRGL